MRTTTLFFSLISILVITSCGNKNKSDDTVDFMNDGGEMLELPNLPDAPRWIDDSEKIFAIEEFENINTLCNFMFESTGHMPMIHTVVDYSPYSNLNEYAGAIDALWADKGQKYIIIIISDRLEELRIIYGELTESALNEDFTDRVMQNDMFPYFKTGNYAKGVENALQSYQRALSK